MDPQSRGPSGTVSRAHVPKSGGLKGPGPSGTNPQASCPQFWGPKEPRARSLQSLSPERPSPQLASLSPQIPIPEQRSHIPAPPSPLESHWKRGHKGAVTIRATPSSPGDSLGDTMCATNLRGGIPPFLWCPRGPRAGGTWNWGIGHPSAGCPLQGSELCPEPFPRTQTTQRSLGAVPRHYSHAGTGKP